MHYARKTREVWIQTPYYLDSERQLVYALRIFTYCWRYAYVDEKLKSNTTARNIVLGKPFGACTINLIRLHVAPAQHMPMTHARTQIERKKVAIKNAAFNILK